MKTVSKVLGSMIFFMEQTLLLALFDPQNIIKNFKPYNNLFHCENCTEIIKNYVF